MELCGKFALYIKRQLKIAYEKKKELEDIPPRKSLSEIEINKNKEKAEKHPFKEIRAAKAKEVKAAKSSKVSSKSTIADIDKHIIGYTDNFNALWNKPPDGSLPATRNVSKPLTKRQRKERGLPTKRPRRVYGQEQERQREREQLQKQKDLDESDEKKESTKRIERLRRDNERQEQERQRERRLNAEIITDKHPYSQKYDFADIKDVEPKLTESELPENPDENELYDLWKNKNIKIETLSRKYRIDPNTFRHLFYRITFYRFKDNDQTNILKQLSPLPKKYQASYNTGVTVLCENHLCIKACPHNALQILPKKGLTRIKSKCEKCTTFACIFSCHRNDLHLSEIKYRNDLHLSEIKFYKFVQKYGEKGIIQSEVWKSLNLHSRDGSRLAIRLEKKGLISRKKILENGRWTFNLSNTSLPDIEKICHKEYKRITETNLSIDQVKELFNKYLLDDEANLKIDDVP